MSNSMLELTTTDVEQVSGGVAPIIGLIGLGLAAFAMGYTIGKDVADRDD